MCNIDKELIVKDKTARIVQIIMEEKHMSLADAVKLWYNSKTKKETLDTEEFYFVSTARCYEELERELNNDPLWMINPFE